MRSCTFVPFFISSVFVFSCQANHATPTIKHVPKVVCSEKPSRDKLAIRQFPVRKEEGWKEIPFVEKTIEPSLTEMEKERGYILFHRPITEIVYPGTKPKASEKIKSLSSFAAQGEFEPIAFSVYPLRDLKKLRVKVSSLKNGEEAIPESNIDARLVTCWNIRYPAYHHKCRTYRRMPELLEKVTAQSLSAMECQRYWITVKVPDNCKPGIYKGEILLSDDSFEKAVSIPVKFKVFGFKLLKDPKKHFTAYIYDLHRRIKSTKTPEVKKFWIKAAENDYKAMAEYGIDSPPTLRPGYDEKQDKIYLSENGNAIDMLGEAGIKGPVPILLDHAILSLYQKYFGATKHFNHWQIPVKPPEKFYSHLTALVAAMEKERRRKNWPEFIYGPLDEVSIHSMDFGVKTYKAVKAAGVRTFITKNPSKKQAEAKAYGPYVDIWCSQPFAVELKKIRETKAEYWSYPNHISTEVRIPKTMARGGRMTYGFGFWKSGYTTLIPWIWRWKHKPVLKFDYLNPKRSSQSGNQIAPNGEIVPSVYWSCFREGYDDGRYAYTLQQAIAERKNSDNPHCAEAVANAKKQLVDIWNAIDTQAKYLHDNSLPDLEFDAFRWKIACAIQGLLKYPAIRKAEAPSILAECISSKASKKPENILQRERKNGNLELLPLYSTRFKWQSCTKEGTLTMENGKAKMKFKVKIDHKNDGGGEAGIYPIGWPRIRVDFEKSINFLAFDGIAMWIKTSSDRDEVADDYTFLSINASASDVKVFDAEMLGYISENSWIPVFLPFGKLLKKNNKGCGDLKKLKTMKKMQIWLGESCYSDGVALTFDIDGPYLYRFKKPFIANIALPRAALLSETKAIPVSIDVIGFGLSHKKKALKIEVSDASGKVVQEMKIFCAGKQTSFNLPLDSFKAGNYTLKASLGDPVISAQNASFELLSGL